MPDVPQDELDRGVSALGPFVRASALSLNPEDLELMAGGVVLEFGRSNEPLERIVDEVEAILDHEREQRAGMHQAWLEEDRPGTAPAAKAVVLAEVRGSTTPPHGIAPDRAESLDVAAPVDLAAARGDDAALAEQLVRLAARRATSPDRASST